jgi:hypothetical protein
MEHGADDEHHGHHPGGAEEEGFSTTKFVDADEEEDACSADFDGAVDTGGEEWGVGFGDADGLISMS